MGFPLRLLCYDGHPPQGVLRSARPRGFPLRRQRARSSRLDILRGFRARARRVGGLGEEGIRGEEGALAGEVGAGGQVERATGSWRADSAMKASEEGEGNPRRRRPHCGLLSPCRETSWRVLGGEDAVLGEHHELFRARLTRRIRRSDGSYQHVTHHMSVLDPTSRRWRPAALDRLGSLAGVAPWRNPPARKTGRINYLRLGDRHIETVSPPRYWPRVFSRSTRPPCPSATPPRKPPSSTH